MIQAIKNWVFFKRNKYPSSNSMLTYIKPNIYTPRESMLGLDYALGGDIMASAKNLDVTRERARQMLCKIKRKYIKNIREL